MNPDTEIPALLHRAAHFHLLATGLAYPDGSLRSRLLNALARLPARAAHTAILFDDLAPAWASTSEAVLSEEYSRLFIGAEAIVPRESTFASTGRSTVLADLNGFYLAFGFDVRPDRREAPDHLGVELEYYSLMLVRQAYAVQQGWLEAYDIAHSASAAFLTDHLDRWTRAVYRQVAERRAAPAYRSLFESIDDGVHRECQMLGVQPAPLESRGPDLMQQEAFVCPLEQAAVPPAAGERSGTPGSAPSADQA